MIRDGLEALTVAALIAVVVVLWIGLMSSVDDAVRGIAHLIGG